MNIGIHPYRCTHRDCGKRARLKAGTPNGNEKCPGCGRYSLSLDRYRLAGRFNPNKDHPPRCDCNGGKKQDQDKIIYFGHGDGEEAVILGPHRLGQIGCLHPAN